MSFSTASMTWLCALITTLCGCAAGVRSEPESDISQAFEPPASWEAGVHFSFADSTHFPDHPYGARVELSMGEGRTRVITARDMFEAPNGSLQTPWYRIPLHSGASQVVAVRVILTDTSGAVSVADYPFTAVRDEFYQVNFGVTTRGPTRPAAPPLASEMRWYPVQSGARRAATDSLVIGYVSRSRSCFDCRS